MTEHRGGDWLRADYVELRRIHVTDQSAHYPWSKAVLPRRPHRLQPVRLTQLQAGVFERWT